MQNYKMVFVTKRSETNTNISFGNLFEKHIVFVDNNMESWTKIAKGHMQLVASFCALFTITKKHLRFHNDETISFSCA